MSSPCSYLSDDPGFIVGDAFAALSQLDVIDVLFYRRDSSGEGGSGIFVLGDSFLRPVLKQSAPKGGLIVTDDPTVVAAISPRWLDGLG